MPRAKQIKITKDGEEGFVLRESVKAWERNGWTVADDESSEAEAAEVSKKPMETQAAAAKKTTTRKAD
jgi:hypothetical protein